MFAIPNNPPKRVKLSISMSALVLWTCLWCNLNSGFWNFVAPRNFDEWQLLVRSVLPFFVLPAAVFLLFARRRSLPPITAPSRLLFIYGAFATFSAFFNPEPLWSLYWSQAFLATIFVAWSFVDRRDPAKSTRQMLQITWGATFIVAAILAREASHSILGEAQTAYFAVNSDLHGLSRSSGVARWAAVPGLVCVVRAYHSRRPLIIAVFLVLASAAFFIVYRMQSRGAVFGSVVALAFALIIGSRMRRIALPFAILAVSIILLVESPVILTDTLDTYVRRGQTKAEFKTMTGRTRAYEHGIAAFQEAPIFGRGQWADRVVILEHVHNSYLQALMNAGVLGGIPYFASWITGWVLFFRLHKRSSLLGPKDRLCLLEGGTVMMFFTVRSMPETTTASFAVDLLVMVAIYVYFEALTVAVRRTSIAQFPMIVNHPYSMQALDKLRPATVSPMVAR
jgi:hypothetical protein